MATSRCPKDASLEQLLEKKRNVVTQDYLRNDLPPWLSGLAISGRGAVKAWLAIRQVVGSYPTPAGMSSQVFA